VILNFLVFIVKLFLILHLCFRCNKIHYTCKKIKRRICYRNICYHYKAYDHPSWKHDVRMHSTARNVGLEHNVYKREKFSGLGVRNTWAFGNFVSGIPCQNMPDNNFAVLAHSRRQSYIMKTWWNHLQELKEKSKSSYAFNWKMHLHNK